MNEYKVLRATEEWQRAGAYSVRIEGMNRQHNISLREEFDEHDSDGTYYIILLDKEYPIATCRFYEIDPNTVTLGRVVVLPNYREQKLGTKVVAEAEIWIKELGYSKVSIDSRTEVIDFYKKLGYKTVDEEVIQNSVFECIKMEKQLG